ncbi:MAG: chromosome segregation protein SMC [Sphingorhabdus sp.]
MRIKRLKLTGFKSFVEPTELRIEAGLTGVVGPNGCGKSNLLEALRWVMGENSPKSMRSGGMEDVIFAGTAQRPQRDFAEVSLLAEHDPHENIPGVIANDDDEELEVVRRIERGAGSAYRANGRDVRAKDIALIFADAATGAHSPALVSQGRIGSIIAAKPQERRMMLEEAAGISGLHVRRKDAEQKLRAAETNLNRLATILGDMDARAQALKKQARQAERYRKLSGEILQAEARLIFVRWTEAKAAAEAARAEADAAGKAVEEASFRQRGFADQQAAAVRQLADDRAAAMAARDAASDLSNRLIQLTGERDRLIQRQADLAAQARRIEEDGAREGKLTHDAAEALARLQGESEALAATIKASEEERPRLTRALDDAERATREGEVRLARAVAEQARAEAELRVAEAALANARARVDRAERDKARLEAERAALGDEAELAAARDAAASEAERLQAGLEKQAMAIEAAETARVTLVSERDAAQSALASARAELAALTAEKKALERGLSTSSDNRAIDRIKVQPGYERALAAALGDDLNAAVGGVIGRRWQGFTAAIPYRSPFVSSEDETPGVGALPQGISSSLDANGEGKKSATKVETLVDVVEAPTELTLRLAMVRVVDVDDGALLEVGERLVTRDGKLRRWDGFFAEDDGAAAAEQLERANRLAALLDAIPAAEVKVADQGSALDGIGERIAAAQERARHLASEHSSTEAALRQALRDADRAEDALTRAQQAAEALVERSELTEQEAAAARLEFESAEKARAELPDGEQQRGLVSALTSESESLRQLFVRAQADLSSLDQTVGQQRERRAVAQAEIRGWQERSGEAERRIAEMNKRSAEIAGELEAIAGKPDTIAHELAELEADKASVAEKLAALQAAEQVSEAALKTLEADLASAVEAVSSAREQRAGAEARAENQDARRREMAAISGERFECPPPLLPEKHGFAEEKLSEASAESARLERLQFDRERIGPVNLIAADELAELETEIEKGQAESEELTQAIHRLRGSIGSLNREGRTRLLAAFEAVDLHFQRLFSTLFNGGQAHLALIESDDPLEAGLEIYAQPPGKKLQSLTLLSGGEQALTAVALIFGLFLTNPAPICVLDEVDAPLDDANIERFCDLLDAMTRETDTRYLIVTHNAVTMSRMHRLFGVTMVEQGVSRLVSVDLGGAEELLAAE